MPVDPITAKAAALTFGSGAKVGMTVGAAVGSVGGPVGSAVGAGVGWVVGGVAGVLCAKAVVDEIKKAGKK